MAKNTETGDHGFLGIEGKVAIRRGMVTFDVNCDAPHRVIQWKGTKTSRPPDSEKAGTPHPARKTLRTQACQASAERRWQTFARRGTLRFAGTTGDFIDVFVALGSGGPFNPSKCGWP